MTQGPDSTHARMAYQLPFPKDALSEIVIPDAVPQDERLWVPQAENVWFRPLCLNRSQGYWMNLLKVTEGRGLVAPPPSSGGPRLCAEGPVALSRA